MWPPSCSPLAHLRSLSIADIPTFSSLVLERVDPLPPALLSRLPRPSARASPRAARGPYDGDPVAVDQSHVDGQTQAEGGDVSGHLRRYEQHLARANRR